MQPKSTSKQTGKGTTKSAAGAGPRPVRAAADTKAAPKTAAPKTAAAKPRTGSRGN